ncbi:carbon storage regulator [Mariniblastus sp.]|nr:carbon storage regulator [Mariniblastus sp.]MDB4368535.1 carbon storage regulator [bacterium]MDA7903014.1 carbon storage regulator [Mariniblastus sp.]MDA7905941.1 carbon storage regulator [Mariniblastus sp.]MDA7924252.1 carbon storage regulator [Mariniblastus sp.]
MLVLSRKESEKIMLGDSIVLTIVRVSGDRVRLGIQAPSDMLILRKELDPMKTVEPENSNERSESDQKKAA